jgi:hypothetical protein
VGSRSVAGLVSLLPSVTLASGASLSVLLASSAIADSGRIPVSGTITDPATGARMAGVLVEAIPDDNAPGARGNNATTDADGRFGFTLAPGRYEFDALAPITGPRASYYEQDFGELPGLADGHLVTVSVNEQTVFNWSLYRTNVPYAGPLITEPSWRHVAGQPFSAMKLVIGDGSYADTPFTWPADKLVLKVTDRWGDLLDHVVTPVEPGGSPREGGSLEEATTGCGYDVGSLRPGRHVGHPKVRDLTEITASAYLQSEPTVSATRTVPVDRSQCFKTELRGRFVGPVITRTQAQAIIDVDGRAPSGKGLDGWLSFTEGRKRRGIHVAASRDSATGISWADLNVARLRLLHLGRNTLRVSFTPSNLSYHQPQPLTIRVRVRR